MSRYCAVVVWYNPPYNAVENISHYVDYVDKVYIVDNSSSDNRKLFSSVSFKDDITYHCFKFNTGLAYALNYGCERAIEEGFDYVLTMDQDSSFQDGACMKLVEYMEANKGNCGIVGPNAFSIYGSDENPKIAYKELPLNETKLCNWIMTSGSLMDLDAYVKAGKFDSDLFIQHVDVDLGIRISEIGYDIVKLGEAVIFQRFGNSEPRRLLWKTVHPSFDNPVRTYYGFRNQIYLVHKLGKAKKKLIGVKLWKSVVKIILFENFKVDRIKMMFRGIYDAKHNRMGKYEKG